MGFIFIIGLLVWGWAEMTAFTYIGNKIGGLFTLLGVFVTAIIGVALLKNQGLSLLKRVRSDMAKGRAPVTSIADSLSLVFGGILMLIPGYVTDVIGFLLFIPGLRTVAGVYVLQWIANSRRFASFVNFGGVPFRGGNGQYSGMDYRQDPFDFEQQQRQQDDCDDIIEGKFEEQPISRSQLHKKKKDRP